MQTAWAYGPAVAALLLGLVPFIRKRLARRRRRPPEGLPGLDRWDAATIALMAITLVIQSTATSGRLAQERAREARDRARDAQRREADRLRAASEERRRRREECAGPAGELAGAVIGERGIRVAGRDVRVPEGATVSAGQFGDEPLRLRREGDRVLASLIVRGRRGDALAVLVDNRWFVAGTRSADKNFVTDALEVLDEEGDPAFQIRFRGGEVQVAGLFYTRDGGGPHFAGPWLHEADGDGPTLFQYPSELHPGELHPGGGRRRRGGGGEGSEPREPRADPARPGT